MSLAPEDQRLLTGALRRMGLIGPTETPELEPLSGGVSSLIVLAHTANGPVCVKSALARLKVAATWLAPVERNTAEVAWLRFAASLVPGKVPRILGEDREQHAFAMNWLAPQDHPVWKNRLRDGIVDLDFAGAVARTLAAIHGASAHRPDLAEGFAHDDQFFALRLDPYLGQAARAHPPLARSLQRLIETTAGHRVALVHGDVSPKNILCGPQGPVLLDAECAWYGDPAFDLAFLLNHLLLKAAWRPVHRPRYLAAFERVRADYLRQVDWERASEIDARAARLLAGLLLARVDGKSPVEYLTLPEQRAPVRETATRLLRVPPASLTEVAAAWAATRFPDPEPDPDEIRR